MQSTFDLFRRFSPAAFVAKAIVAAAVANVLLLAFILARRAYRKRYFRKRDARIVHFRERWDELVAGRISYESWRGKSLDCGIIEDLALDSFEIAESEESAKLLKFLRS